MATVIRNVGELDRSDRTALERVVGHKLADGQQITIQITSSDQAAIQSTQSNSVPELPDWTDVYKGLDDSEVEELDAAIRERANLTRPTNKMA